MKRLRIAAFGLAVLPLVGALGISNADETVPAVAELPPPSTVQLEGWLRALRSGDFSARTEATHSLVAAGAAAVEAVSRAAETGDLETSSRCLEILKRLRSGNDADAKGAAEKALESLAQSKNRSVAQRATALTEKPDPVDPRNLAFRQFVVRGNGIQVIAPAPIVPARRVQREATVEDNGKRVELREVLGTEVVVRVTETVDGKPKVTEFKSANAAELFQKHPEAYALYAKHLRGKPFQDVANPNAARAAIAQLPIPNIQVQIGQGGNNFRMRMTNVNGQRTIEVDENGKRTVITDEGGKNIKVRITESKDGKDATREFEAQDAAELRKKHPEAADAYDRFAGEPGNGIQVIGGAIQLQPRGIRRAAPFAPIPGRAIPIQPLPIEAQPEAPKPEKP